MKHNTAKERLTKAGIEILTEHFSSPTGANHITQNGIGGILDSSTVSRAAGYSGHATVTKAWPAEEGATPKDKLIKSVMSEFKPSRILSAEAMWSILIPAKEEGAELEEVIVKIAEADMTNSVACMGRRAWMACYPYLTGEQEVARAWIEARQQALVAQAEVYRAMPLLWDIHFQEGRTSLELATTANNAIQGFQLALDANSSLSTDHPATAVAWSNTLSGIIKSATILE